MNTNLNRTYQKDTMYSLNLFLWLLRRGRWVYQAGPSSSRSTLLHWAFVPLWNPIRRSSKYPHTHREGNLGTQANTM